MKGPLAWFCKCTVDKSDAVKEDPVFVVQAEEKAERQKIHKSWAQGWVVITGKVRKGINVAPSDPLTVSVPSFRDSSQERPVHSSNTHMKIVHIFRTFDTAGKDVWELDELRLWSSICLNRITNEQDYLEICFATSAQPSKGLLLKNIATYYFRKGRRETDNHFAACISIEDRLRRPTPDHDVVTSADRIEIRAALNTVLHSIPSRNRRWAVIAIRGLQIAIARTAAEQRYRGRRRDLLINLCLWLDCQAGSHVDPMLPRKTVSTVRRTERASLSPYDTRHSLAVSISPITPVMEPLDIPQPAPLAPLAPPSYGALFSDDARDAVKSSRDVHLIKIGVSTPAQPWKGDGVMRYLQLPTDITHRAACALKRNQHSTWSLQDTGDAYHISQEGLFLSAERDANKRDANSVYCSVRSGVGRQSAWHLEDAVGGDCVYIYTISEDSKLYLSLYHYEGMDYESAADTIWVCAHEWKSAAATWHVQDAQQEESCDETEEAMRGKSCLTTASSDWKTISEGMSLKQEEERSVSASPPLPPRPTSPYSSHSEGAAPLSPPPVAPKKLVKKTLKKIVRKVRPSEDKARSSSTGVDVTKAASSRELSATYETPTRTRGSSTLSSSSVGSLKGTPRGEAKGPSSSTKKPLVRRDVKTRSASATSTAGKKSVKIVQEA
eukprot:TRINITY_DN3115_c0_g3_i1.p1 TRINITY_DN3115_c0_g3~~TRINITY_DN3115_c0_g3_i1.p1  ORF type:complete len:666 (+),score=123.30 TRINITY_DN3115_c0_g3_i1:42-2039(+)